MEKYEFIAMLNSIKTCFKRNGSDKVECNHTECDYKNKRNTLIIKFLWSTGARISEVCNLNIEDLNRKEPKGWFKRSKRLGTRLFKLDDEFH